LHLLKSREERFRVVRSVVLAASGFCHAPQLFAFVVLNVEAYHVQNETNAARFEFFHYRAWVG
jgi:hypothetical protein